MQIADINAQVVDQADTPYLLERDGFVRVFDCVVADLQAFLRTWTEPYRHPHETAGGLTIIRPLPAMPAESGRAAFTSSHLGLHTDRATEAWPPPILSTLVMEQSETGGEALLFDGREISSILTADRSTMTDLVLTDGGEATVPIFEEAGLSLYRIRYRDDDVARPAALTKKGAKLLADVRKRLEQPVKLTLGIGEGYIVHNHRYLHGRQSFSGERVVARFLASMPVGSRFGYLNEGYKLPWMGTEPQPV